MTEPTPIRCRLVFTGGAVLNLLVPEVPRPSVDEYGRQSLPPENWQPLPSDKGDQLAWIDWSQVVAVAYRETLPPRPTGRPRRLLGEDVLEYLREQNRWLTTGEVAGRFDVARPTMSRVFDRLAEAGEVEVRKGPRGARLVLPTRT